MPTKAQHLNEKSSTKNKEAKAKTKPASQSAKQSKAAATSAKKENSTKAKPTKPKATGAKKTAAKSKPSVKSTEKKSTAKKKTAERKAPAAKKPAKSAAKAKKTVKKTTKTDAKVAAATKKEAAAEKKEPKEILQTEKPTITSETAKKVAGNLIRTRTKKKTKASKTRTPSPIAFTLDEAIKIAETQKAEEAATTKASKTPVKEKKTAPKKEQIEEIKQENRVLGAASLADILGYNPDAGHKSQEEENIPPKFQRYYKLLIELRNVVKEGLDIHTKETLNRSSKDDSGNLSAYSQHMADMGTDTFDRDFALNLVSSEQEALFEIEDAIRRIKQGTYGICEITGKPINKERLLAVPFARYSMEGQIEYEQNKRRNSVRGSIVGPGEALRFMETESDDD